MSEPDFVVNLVGRDIGFKDMRPGQIAMANLAIERARKRVREVGEAKATMEMMSQIFNLIESLIITDEDREHVMDAMLTGQIDLPEAFLILRRGEPEAPDDDEDDEPKKKSKPTASRSRVRR